MNIFVFGPAALPDTTGTGQVATSPVMELFHCPSDIGFTDNPTAISESFKQPMFQYFGNSYAANVLLGQSAQTGDPDMVWSLGPYLRPATRIPAPSETVAYFETFADAAHRYRDTSDNPQPHYSVMGWHRRLGRFNVAFCDGHVRTVSMLKSDFF